MRNVKDLNYVIAQKKCKTCWAFHVAIDWSMGTNDFVYGSIVLLSGSANFRDVTSAENNYPIPMATEISISLLCYLHR